MKKAYIDIDSIYYDDIKYIRVGINEVFVYLKNGKDVKKYVRVR